MTQDERLQHLRWVLERQLHWISAADTKAAGLVGAYIALVSIAASLAERAEVLQDGTLTLLVISGSLLLVGVALTLRVFFPRTGSPNPSGIFFGEISKRSSPDYAAYVCSIDATALEIDLCNQVHTNAVIASVKHQSLRQAMLLAALALAVWLPTVAAVAINT